MHLMLVDTHLREKWARDEQRWEESSAYSKLLCNLVPLPQRGRARAMQPFAIYRTDFHLHWLSSFWTSQFLELCGEEITVPFL